MFTHAHILLLKEQFADNLLYTHYQPLTMRLQAAAAKVVLVAEMLLAQEL
jgi:hypothetical protein